ncbi:MAG: hypothetical protein FWD39_01630 [Clostridiales bacterium]|nr:hypothetical protein [Clostridiales bacterium]
MKSHFKSGFGGIVFSLLVFAVLLGFLFFAVGDADKSSDLKQREFLLRALRNAAISCYAIEGHYPARLEYLEEHYGVVIDHDKYIVDYEIFSSNIMPVISISIRPKEWR